MKTRRDDRGYTKMRGRGKEEQQMETEGGKEEK